MTYEYYAFSNKLKNVDGSDDENYTYDEIGNLISDEDEGITNIEWTPYGKVRKVVKDDNTEVHFRYDASGNRIAKITATDTTVYARDASGNVMAVYKGKELEEQSIYGSSRLGLVNYASKTGYRSLGGKKYELSNHLGNVLAVVSDNIHLDQDSTWTSLINTTDYYPFGLAMDGRSVQDSTYRYGFNGHEKDDEIKGPGNHLSFGDYGYDPRLGRRWNIDPEIKNDLSVSPFFYSFNNPVNFIDSDGRWPKNSLVPGLSTHLIVAGSSWIKSKINSSISKLSTPEQSVVQRNLYNAYMAKDNRKIAENFLRNSNIPKDPIAPYHNDEGDAFRHAMWGALTTQTSGEEFTREIGIAHELGVPNEQFEREMDLFNNEMGIKIGKENPGASRNQIALKVLEELKRGNLKVIKSVNIDNDRFQNIEDQLNNLYDSGKTSDEVLYGEGN